MQKRRKIIFSLFLICVSIINVGFQFGNPPKTFALFGGFKSHLPYLKNPASQIWCQNLSAYAATFIVEFYGPITWTWLPSSTISPRGTFSLSLDTISELPDGEYSAVIFSDLPLSCLTIKDPSIDKLWGIYPAIWDWGNGLVFFGPVFKNANGMNSLLSIMNPQDAPVTVSINFYSSNGNLVHTTTTSIIQPGYGINLNTASEFGIPEEFAGSVVISGRYENNLPAPIVMSVTQIGASHYSNDFGRTHGDNRITLPRLFKSFDEGSGELSSTIYITNVNPDNPTPVTLNLYDDKTCYIRNFSLGPYAMAAINVDMDSDLPKNTVFSGVLTYSDAAIIASEISWVEGTAGLHTGYSGLVIDVNQVSLPRLIRHPDQYSVIRIFNAGSSTADLTLRFLDFNGNSVLEYPITNLPSLGLKRIKLINLPGLPANFEGSGLVEISTPDSDIGVVVDEYLPNGHGFLDLPITYENHHSLAIQNFDDNGRITAWFDHNLPNYDNNQEIIIYDGRNLKSSAKLEFDSFQELFYFEDSNRHQYYYDGHNGNDFNGGRISILASGDGVVIQAGCGAYGNQIIIDHGNGYYTLYGHLSEINVSRGEIVEKKQIIGITGGSGREEGSLICVPNLFRTHLHFGVFKDNGNNIWEGGESINRLIRMVIREFPILG